MKTFMLIILVLICIALSACSVESNGMIERSYVDAHHAEEKNEIFSYVLTNQGFLLDAIEKTANWDDEYYYFSGVNEIVVGKQKVRPYERIEVLDESVTALFKDETIDFILFSIPNDVVLFEISGKGIAPSSKTLGFYYSPEDKPVWISSEQLVPVEYHTGKYLHYPMIKAGNGWIPDTSVLHLEKDDLLKGYGSYSERICENFFYFESWY